MKSKQQKIILEGWTLKTLQQCGELVKETYQPSKNESLSYIGLEHIEKNSLSLSSVGSSSQVSSNKFKFKKGDILFGKLRPYFRKVILADFDGVCSTDIFVVRAKNEIDKKFLFYLMGSTDFIEFASRATIGTKMPRTTWDWLKRYEFSIPKVIAEQKLISNILSLFDEQTHLLKKLNMNLEKIIQAIYDSCFVNFDGHDEFDETVIGSIPKGWEVKKLHEVAEITMGLSPPGSSYNEKFEGLPLLNGPADFSNGFLTPEKYSTDPKRICDKDDILLCIRATIGNLTFSDKKYCIGRGVASFTPKKKYHEFLYQLTKSHVSKLIQESAGSVIMGLLKEDLENISFPYSDDSILGFHNKTSMMFNKISNNQKRIKNSLFLRDALAPKLLSGEIWL